MLSTSKRDIPWKILLSLRPSMLKSPMTVGEELGIDSHGYSGFTLQICRGVGKWL